MSYLGDRKKRIALAMGLASFFGAGKASLAVTKPAVSKGQNVNTEKSFFTSIKNMSTSKKFGIGAAGLFAIGLGYEAITDTVLKDSKLPSIGKAAGWVKRGPGKPDEEKEEEKEEEKDKKKDERKEMTAKDYPPETNYNVILGTVDKMGMCDLAHENYTPKERKDAHDVVINIAKFVGITKQTLKQKGAYYKVESFLVPVARKMGLDEKCFSPTTIKNLCCHNYEESSDKIENYVKKMKRTEHEKKALLLISRLRNIIDYEAGYGTGNSEFKGDLLTRLQNELPDN